MTGYLESSAIVKLLRKEAESAALVQHLSRRADTAIGCVLSETEVRRAATRDGVSQEDATRVLDQFDLVDLDRAIFLHAGLISGATLRSLDAIHVAVAVREDVDEFITYDQRQAEAAASCGLRVISPR